MNELIMPHNVGVKNVLENMKEVLAEFWKVAIIRLINDREKKEPLAVRVLRDYNAERRMTDYR